MPTTLTPKERRMIAIVRGAFLFKALLFVGFGIAHYAIFQTQTAFIIAILLLVDAAIFLWFSRAIMKRSAFIFGLAIAFLIANILATIMDQFGYPDLFVLLIDAALLILLILQKRLFLPIAKQQAETTIKQ